MSWLSGSVCLRVKFSVKYSFKGFKHKMTS
uniref:Uncharacterized protein n=1 Tax=Anguilla anguilla TaxID=7936 RepID=A0A0E9XTH6_ANGAN